jgi:hypothetical protein
MSSHDVGIGPDPVPPGPDLDESWQRVSNLFDRPDEAPLLELVLSVFEEQGVDHELPDPEVTIVVAHFSTDDDQPIDVWVRTHEANETISVRSIVPGDFTDDQRQAVTVLAGRANRNVEVGSYELDPEGGPLTFKTALDVEGDRLSVALLRALVGTAIVAADVMTPLLADVLAGGDPLAAGAEV